MSDGHSDLAKYSRFYQAELAERKKRIANKLKKMRILSSDNEIMELKGLRLLISKDDIPEDTTVYTESDKDKVYELTELLKKLIRDRKI